MNVNALADIIERETGWPVCFEQTGGGIRTLYAGKQDRLEYYPLAAGPCWWDEEQDGLVADAGEFCWGPDCREEPDEYSVDEDTLETVAAKVVAWINNRKEPA